MKAALTASAIIRKRLEAAKAVTKQSGIEVHVTPDDTIRREWCKGGYFLL